MNLPALDPQTVMLAGAAATLAAGGVVAWWRRRPQDPEEIERRRRSYLNSVGRIVEGQVLEIQEFPAPAAPPRRRGLLRRASTNGTAGSRAGGNGGKASVASSGGNGAVRHLVFYTYSISGVTYETAQDLTGLEERACLNRVVTGLPVSVKYDPSNPGNSILIADDWSGLH